jgi:hypothetical protein
VTETFTARTAGSLPGGGGGGAGGGGVQPSVDAVVVA